MCFSTFLNSLLRFPQKKKKRFEKQTCRRLARNTNNCRRRSEAASGRPLRLPRHHARLLFLREERGRKATLKCFASGAISKPWDVQKPCKLVLEDGSVWQGKAFGADGTKVGEVVFNTSLSGYVSFSLL